jgi:HNH endonuclease
LACDAALIPHVLGTAGEDLDLGRVVRLFTRAQRRRLLRRDRGCTYPGCTAPAAWSRAHHVIHWLDGGRSDMDNAALLCQRHHTFVHKRRLVATVRAAPDEQGQYVVWDLSEGSYDRHLKDLRAERAVHDPTVAA